MIKFFRIIRRRLLTENKFNTYILYAIGEITLVVIGILIALSINNWNERRQLVAQGEEYIGEIYGDLEKEVYNLKEIVSGLQKQYDATENALRDF